MNFKANAIRLQFTEDNQTEIVLSTHRIDITELKEIIAKGKELSVEIKQHRDKRSLDANAYLWVLLQKMAEILHSSKEEVYEEVVCRYGVFTHVIVKPEAVERVKQEWRAVRDLGEVMVNGKTGIQLQCYFGSSTYNTKEMGVLIDGVVSEAKEMGIETMTPGEIQILKKEWGVSK